MTDLMRVPARGTENTIHVVVETPRGTRAKIKLDPQLNAFIYVRPMPQGLSYPFDWGFIPSTCGADGDPLDAMVLHSAACPSGTVIPCRPLAVLEVRQTEKGKAFRNDRYIMQPINTRGVDDIRLTRQLKTELEHFFADAISHTRKKLKFLGWKSAGIAARQIALGRKAWTQKNS
jgi:inorganic pyrophosphatase